MLIAAGPMTAMNRQGRMQKIRGMVILTGTCCAFSSARWRRLIRISVDWTRRTAPIGMPNASAWASALTKLRARQVGSLGQRTQRFVAALADLHLAQHPGELLCERPGRVAGHLLKGGVEAEAGLDRDRQQVDRVREALLDLVLPVVGALVEEHVRSEVAERNADGDDDDLVVLLGLIRTAKSSETTNPPTPPSTLEETMRSTVQPGGLPASSSLRRMRSPVSAPLRRRPIPRTRLRSGSRTRSLKG